MVKDSLYTKDEGEFAIQTISPNTSLVISADNTEVGRLDWGTGKLEFSGELESSARQFFEFLKPYVDNYIEHN